MNFYSRAAAFALIVSVGCPPTTLWAEDPVILETAAALESAGGPQATELPEDSAEDTITMSFDGAS